ncbi:hypothetical protein [Phyllobacterium sp. UNC302MFCol5.2]|uniref:hypothetical protein n=1 Tax=Phyllobacterium sp. UNC302MFCol5.2 TaxID=1449065 RepID=UPI00068AFBCF|nr:hypothetical protein [Phyllobacterium sp. UNC302MFCol5.2]
MKQGAGIGRRALVGAMAGAFLVLPFKGAPPARAADLPVIAFFRSSPAGPFASLVEAFRKGVAEEGLVEGETVAIEYRWADNKPELLPQSPILARNGPTQTGSRFPSAPESWLRATDRVRCP